MKILILSDSHGAEQRLTDILIDNNDADCLVFLGDGGRDFENALASLGIFPYGKTRKTVLQVAGNCDRFSNEATSLLESFGSIKVLITHGHAQNVKYGYARLADEAGARNCRIALFGHTHRKELCEVSGVTLFNPGSVRGGSYGVLEVTGDRFEFRHQEC